MTDAMFDRPIVLPGGDEELRLTVHTELPGAVQVWGRVTASAMTRDADSDDPFTLTSLTLNGRVYDGRLREALLDIQDMHDNARGNWQVALADALAVLTKIQPVDNGAERPATAPTIAHPPLTMDMVHALSRLANAAQRGTRVRWLTEEDESVSGTLRHLVQADSDTFPREGDDPRDCRVRITADLGTDYYFPVAEVVTRMANCEFAILD